jgi:uncharacterized membrane protein YoaK (UPF0700 family)
MNSERVPAAERLALLLSFNGGYVDTVGFIGLHGLFTAHVTGNFVTIGYALANGASGVWTKLAALPVFCIGVFCIRAYSLARQAQGKPVFGRLLVIMTALLLIGAVLAVWLGPFADPDDWGLLATGMMLVAAMSVQNAAHRSYLGAAPPSTLMTGTTTQLMLDAADALSNTVDHERRPRMQRMGQAIASFALGCAAAALLYVLVGTWSFALPPVVSLVILVWNRHATE